MKWYLADSWGDPKVSEIEIEKFTDSNVWINGRKHKRVASRESFFMSRPEAVEYLVKIAQDCVKAQRLRLIYAERQLRLAEELRKEDKSCPET